MDVVLIIKLINGKNVLESRSGNQKSNILDFSSILQTFRKQREVVKAKPPYCCCSNEVRRLLSGSFSKPLRRRQQEHYQTKGLMSKIVVLHVRFASLFIS